MEIIKKIFQDELKYDGNVILKYTIEYPQVVYSKWKMSAKIFNEYNEKKAIQLKRLSTGKLFYEAKELYEYNKKNGYPSICYEVYSKFKVTYNTNNILSLYIDEYIYQGGAHGLTNRTSQNWDFRTGSQIRLNELFIRNPNYVTYILTKINKKISEDIKNGNNIYFENYCCLTSETFSVNNFYLQDGKVIIYYQQYDIAPYSSGILTFEI